MTVPGELVRIEMLLDSGRHRDALGQLSGLLAVNPHDPELWSGVARAHIGLDEHAAALEAAMTVVRLRPDAARGHLFASIALLGLKRKEEALTAAVEATRAAPLAWVAHTQVAEVASTVRRHRQTAWAAANRAVELAPLESNTHATMGLVALRAGNRQVAEQALTEALRLDPSNHAAQHNLGIVRLGKGQMVAAAQDLGRAAAADPNAPETTIAFRAVILRWLRNSHWALWGFWILDRLSAASGREHEGLWWPSMAIALLALGVLGWWTRRTIVAVGGHLRGVLWRVLRRSVLTAAWFMAVALGGLTLVVGSFMPDPQVRDYLTSATGAALLLGVVLSWMQVFATRRA